MAWILMALACAPDVMPPDQEADPARVTAPSRRKRIYVEPPGGRRWTPELAVGVCTTRDEYGAVTGWTSLNADGEPIESSAADGESWSRWLRWRDEGVLRTGKLYRHSRDRPYGQLVLEERYDRMERVIWRGRDAYSFQEWRYDGSGRVSRTFDVGAEVYEETWHYAADGQVEKWEYDGSISAGWHDLEWSEGRLVSTRNYDRWSDFSEMRWTSWHESGLPEHGEARWEHSDGNSGSWTEDWSYDAAGHPIGHSLDGRRREVWAWEADRVVRHEVYGTTRDGVETLIDEEDWAWDDEGRIIAYDDGKGPRTWEWDPSGQLAGYSDGERSWTFEGDCPAGLFYVVPAPTPGPLPLPPEAPSPSGG